MSGETEAEITEAQSHRVFHLKSTQWFRTTSAFSSSSSSSLVVLICSARRYIYICVCVSACAVVPVSWYREFQHGCWRCDTVSLGLVLMVRCVCWVSRGATKGLTEEYSGRFLISQRSSVRSVLLRIIEVFEHRLFATMTSRNMDDYYSANRWIQSLIVSSDLLWNSIIHLIQHYIWECVQIQPGGHYSSLQRLQDKFAVEFSQDCDHFYVTNICICTVCVCVWTVGLLIVVNSWWS